MIQWGFESRTVLVRIDHLHCYWLLLVAVHMQAVAPRVFCPWCCLIIGAMVQKLGLRGPACGMQLRMTTCVGDCQQQFMHHASIVMLARLGAAAASALYNCELHLVGIAS
jgi:hypothetical protein